MKSLFFALLLTSTCSFAAIESNYTLVPAAGQIEATPSIGLYTANTEYKNNGGDVKTAGFNLGGKFFYGITDFLAVGAEVGYTTIRSNYNRPNMNTTTNKGKGLNDPAIKAKGLVDLSAVGIFYSVGYAPTLEDSEYNSDSDEYNMASGQNSYILEAGVVVPVAEYLAGANIEYQKHLEGSEKTISSGNTTTSTLKESGEHTLRAYFEFEKNYHMTGAFIHTRTTALLQGLEFTSRFPLGPQTELLPKITYLTPKHKEANEELVNIVVFEGAFRFTF